MRLRAKRNYNVNKIIWLNPNKIIHYTKEYDPLLNMGIIKNGDWDRDLKRFEELDVFKAIKKRYIQGIKWGETAFYDRLLKNILQGDIIFGCSNKNELNNRMAKIDLLYKDIKKGGYKSNKSLYKEKTDISNWNLEDEITINIGRNGQLLFNDGRHRLSIVKILKIDSIPVKVVVRHKLWLQLRTEMIAFANKSGGQLYQPLTHPDLRDIPSLNSSYRLILILNNIRTKKGSVLDIGSQLGYFCHKLEEKGYTCHAVEYDYEYLYFLNKTKQIENRKFKIITESIFNYNREQDLIFDVVLCLNVFHHFLKIKETYFELIHLLKRIKANEIFFQCHKYDEPQMKNAYINYYPDEFADFISKHVNMKYVFLAETSDMRRIYHFFR